MDDKPSNENDKGDYCPWEYVVVVVVVVVVVCS
jgi:hypothetical protein